MVAKLTISDLAVGLIVVEEVSDRDLSMGPGHVSGTSLPGEAGNEPFTGPSAASGAAVREPVTFAVHLRKKPCLTGK